MAQFERCVSTFDDMGRYRVIRCVIRRNTAPGGRNCSLRFVSFDRYRRTDLLLFSVGFVASGDRFRRDSSGALRISPAIYRPVAAHGGMAFPVFDLSIDAGIRPRETSHRRPGLAQSDRIELPLRNTAFTDSARVVFRSLA